MSGGQQQRVMIAMAIACEPKLLIADEPTTALDVTIQKQIVELIAKLQQRRRMAVLFITHDLGLVGEIADRVIVMRHGEVREEGSASQVLHAPEDPYTRALLACRPTLDARPLRLPTIADFLGQGGPAQARADAQTQRVRGYAPGDDNVLVVKGLSKSFWLREGWFGKREFQAVKDVSFTLARGKTLGVVGESGSGKTTVGLSLLRLHRASGGSALFDGRDLFAMSERESSRTNGASRSCSRIRTPRSIRASRSARSCSSRCASTGSAPATPGASSMHSICCSASACRPRPSDATRTSFPAASASASRSRAA